MKRMVVLTVLLFCGLHLFAQTPNYTASRLADGTLAIECPSETDALLVLQGGYNLPDTFIIAVLLKGIYLEEIPFLSNLPDPMYLLGGTKLVQSLLGGACDNFYNLDKNTEYHVIWRRRPDPITSYFSMVIDIVDKNGVPLTPIKK